MTSITLVLGSGGARGLSFVGALQALAEAGVRVGRVVGSSMGALIGAAYCSGTPLADIEEAVRGLRLRRLLRPTLRGPGFLSRRPIERLAAGLISAARFEDLVVPLEVVCTDLGRGEAAAFDSGALLPPVVGSCLTAGAFAPVLHEGRLLVDGGYTDPVPARVSRQGETVLILDPCARPDWDLPVGISDGRSWLASPRLPCLAALKAMDALILSLVDERLRSGGHLRVVPDLGSMRFTDFHLADFAISRGRMAVRQSLIHLDASLKPQ